MPKQTRVCNSDGQWAFCSGTRQSSGTVVVDAVSLYELLKQYDLQEILSCQEIGRNDNNMAYELGGMACARGVDETCWLPKTP